MLHARRPCDECPWRRDVVTGRFSPDRYEALAETARDMARPLFACHKSEAGRDVTCAGFLLRGAEHNLTVRMAIFTKRYDPSNVSDGGIELYNDYTEMARANGARLSALRGVR